MTGLFNYEFMRNAVIAAFLVNIACGIMGTYIVVKRITFISGGISHAAFGGIGLGYFLGINPIITAIPFSIACSMAAGLINRKNKFGEDVIIGILWAAGMAIGIIFINLSPGYAPDLFSYLFGNILTIPVTDIYIMIALDTLIVLLVIIFYNELMILTFDQEFAEIKGIPAKVVYLLLLSMIALSVVVLIRVVGIILVIALLTIPASICRQFTYNLKKMIIGSIITGIFLTLGGLFISYMLDLSSGATIILFSVIIFLISYLIKYTFNIIRKKTVKI